jgi:hypothetical protein
VPEPTVLGVTDVLNDNRMWQLEATLGRLLTSGTISLQVAADFGPQDAVNMNGTWTFGPNQSNCDFDHNGKINYSDPNEGPCADACNGSSTAAPTDYQCSEYSSFASESDFELIATDTANTCTSQTDCANGYVCTGVASGSSCVATARVQADTAAADLFDPVLNRGQTIGAITGVVSYFSGGSSFTLNARCDDDVAIIVPAGQKCPTGQTCQPLTSNVACVTPRTQAAINNGTAQ